MKYLNTWWNSLWMDRETCSVSIFFSMCLVMGPTPASKTRLSWYTNPSQPYIHLSFSTTNGPDSPPSLTATCATTYIYIPLPLPLTHSHSIIFILTSLHFLEKKNPQKITETPRNFFLKKKKHENLILTTMAVTIKIVKARQIFDSRGNPTVEVSFVFFFSFFVFCLESWEKMSGKMKKKIIFHVMELINTITISVAPTLLIEYVSDTGTCYYI